MSRTEIEALEARHAALAAELAERMRARDEVARMLAEVEAGTAARRRSAAWIMIAIAALGVVVIAIGGLSIYRATRPHDPPTNGVAERFEQFTTELCRCATPSCVEVVTVATQRWAELVMKEQPPVEIDDATRRRLAELGSRWATCVRDVR